SSFFSATSAQRNASLRACSRPSACSRTMWMSANGSLLQFAMPLLLGQLAQLPGRIIEPLPVVAAGVEQRLEGGHQFVVGSLRAEVGVVRVAHPAVVAAPQGGVEAGARLQ